MKLRKLISAHEIRPPFYGIAWEEDFARQWVCYPIPLNWVLGWAREIAWYLSRGPRGCRSRELRALLLREYKRGYADGVKHTESYFVN